MFQEAAALLLTLLTLSGTLELLLVTIGAFLRLPSKPASSQKMRTVVLIPAHNEAKDISAAVSSLKKNYSEADIYVIADNCTDKTADIAVKAGVQVIIRNDPEKRGKHYALNYAINKIIQKPYDILLFMDADSVASPNLIDEVGRTIGSGYPAVQVKNLLTSDYISYKQRLIRIGFNAIDLLRPLGRQGWGLSSGIFGNGFAVRKEILEKIPFPEDTLVEDAAYHLKLVEEGFHVAFNSAAEVSSYLPEKIKHLSEQHASWEGGRIGLLIHQFPSIFSSIMKGHFRLIEPLLDLLLLPLSYQTILLILLLFLSPAWSTAYAVAGLTILILHLGASLIISKASWKDYLSLLAVPFYIIAKLLLLPRILLQARKKARWERRSRSTGKRGSA